MNTRNPGKSGHSLQLMPERWMLDETDEAVQQVQRSGCACLQSAVGTPPAAAAGSDRWRMLQASSAANMQLVVT